MEAKEDQVARRADAVINSPAFRQQLEAAIRTGSVVDDSPSLRHLFDGVVALEPAASSGPVARPKYPIDDIGDRVIDGYAPGEKDLRCQLACLYRLVDHFGWTQSIFNHITARVPGEEEHFLLNPFGLLYHEVTASSLIKVDLQGRVVHGGSTLFGVNYAGFVLHSAVHAARADARFVLHIHHPPCVAVASMECGFLRVSQEAALLGDSSYHDFEGVLIDEAERRSIADHLGPVNQQMFLRNHGVVCLDRTAEMAFNRLYNVVLGCEAQVRMMAAGGKVSLIEKATIDKALELMRRGFDFTAAGKLRQLEQESPLTRTPHISWSPSDVMWESYMRMLDDAGYRTGYKYRMPSYRRPESI